MLIGRVVGEVVSSHKEEKMEGLKLLLVEKTGPDGSLKKDHLVAIDAVGAGRGDLVLVVAGSSARMTETTTGRPSDATVMAIIEQIDSKGDVVYNKSEDVYVGSESS